jgi:RNA processing factor Prp31
MLTLLSFLTLPTQGFIYGCELIQRTPPPLRSRASRLVGGKVALLARMDAYGQDPTVSNHSRDVGQPSQWRAGIRAQGGRLI